MRAWGSIVIVTVEISDWMEIPAAMGESHVYAIGDVHGLSGHFEALLGAMAAKAAGGGELVLLGDLIDRGPDGVGVLRSAARSAAELGFGTKTVVIGNHEIMMQMSMRPGPSQTRHLAHWSANGGSAILHQVGLTGPVTGIGGPIADRVIRDAIGPDAMAMIEEAASHREVGNLLFVHGGIDPAVPLSEWFARPRLAVGTGDLHYAWIRSAFLFHQGPFEGNRLVVHGHSQEHLVVKFKGYPPDRAHRLDGWRIGLDGGSYGTGRVVGGEFQTGRYRLFTAS